MKTVAKNIKKFRELKSITRETMAADLGMSLSGYSKLERGEVDLTLSRVNKIAQILDVSFEQLMNFDPLQIINNQKNKEDVQTSIYSDDKILSANNYKDKYIRLLENELDRLRKLEKGE
jgi:transcriptional regulator with XRE-family HTH domain